ncbi:hypothetical protein ACTJIJ_15175 [Niabella sp. 22666]|uniref:hypothetical protein n=1 Tax=Niabella sp. 22666 TaxID=3453954 RepID=UPI003F858F39
MIGSIDDRVTTLSKELKNLVEQFDYNSFISQVSYLCNMHWRNQTGVVKLKSPIKQLMYLVSLYLSTDWGGTKQFEVISDDFNQIIKLLNDIEDSYVVDESEIFTLQPSVQELKKLYITNSSLLSYYMNAQLSYIEQDIYRIHNTFKDFDSHISAEFGLNVEDFITFFLTVTDLEIDNYNEFLRGSYPHNISRILKKASRSVRSLTDGEFSALDQYTENSKDGLAISVTKVAEHLGLEKVKILLALFTHLRKPDDSYLYYADSCNYLKRPILMLSEERFVMLYSKQLINAIYELLFDYCSGIDREKRKVWTKRDKLLEKKTLEVFSDFFGNMCEFYSGYYINGVEKDLLILDKNEAYIVECKAHKQRPPFRDPDKAIEKLKDDFKRCIGKGYSQAKEVEEFFYSEKSFDIKNSKGRVVRSIDPNSFENIFVIVVTQERFAQIQCDLSLLMEDDQQNNYPWAVCIDDLETFLITLKRRKNHTNEFVEFLLAREHLHGRLLCRDELELCAYFLFDNYNFIKSCHSDKVFISSPDMNKFFDLLYYGGLGFSNEINLGKKLERNSSAPAIAKKFKLDKPEKIKEFLIRKRDTSQA